jgi:hypothetical protein
MKTKPVGPWTRARNRTPTASGHRRGTLPRGTRCLSEQFGGTIPGGILRCERRESNPDPLRDRILSSTDGGDSRQVQTTSALRQLDLRLGSVVSCSPRLSPVAAQVRHRCAPLDHPPVCAGRPGLWKWPGCGGASLFAGKMRVWGPPFQKIKFWREGNVFRPVPSQFGGEQCRMHAQRARMCPGSR